MTSAVPSKTASLDAAAYREAMARIASAVHIVATDGPAGRAAFTASAVCSVSDVPPTVLVCINRNASAYAAFCGNEVLCVSTLGAAHQGLAAAFGGRTPMEERFAAGRWRLLGTGAPVLADALVALDCRIVGRHAVGTHDVLYCEVQAVAASAEAETLVYHDRRYRTLHEPAAARPVPAERLSAPRALDPRLPDSPRIAVRSA